LVAEALAHRKGKIIKNQCFLSVVEREKFELKWYNGIGTF